MAAMDLRNEYRIRGILFPWTSGCYRFYEALIISHKIIVEDAMN